MSDWTTDSTASGRLSGDGLPPPDSSAIGRLRPGDVLDGDFELVRKLGEGGMGTVWLARERSLGRDVALKLMRPSGSPARERRFDREARALAALDHPGILPVLHAGADPATGLHYLATRPVLLSHGEICRLCASVLRCPLPFAVAEAAEAAEATATAAAAGAGRNGAAPSEPDGSAPVPLPLAALLADGKALPEDAVLRIARDLAGALATAHSAGILHRDIKPSNILFDSTGRAILSDFGLAKFMGSAGGSGAISVDSEGAAAEGSADVHRPFPEREPLLRDGSLSLDGSGRRKFLGSPAYAAPEQFRGGAPLSPAIDWYAFGAVLYEALTGRRPRPLRAPSSYDPAHISCAWDAFLAELLDPDPARRLSDPGAILRRLDRIGRSLCPAVRRRRATIAVLIALVASLAAGAVAWFRHQATGTFAAESRLRPVDISALAPASPMPPRLAGVWQGDNRGPLQLLNAYRMEPVDRVIEEAFATADPELLRLVREGDGAWEEWGKERNSADRGTNALARANAAYRAAVDKAENDAGPDADALPRVRLAVCLSRLAWTYVAAPAHRASDEPYRAALATIAPLSTADPVRFAPLKSWLMADRASMECMEARFQEAERDVQEALSLLKHAPMDDPGCRMQLAALLASSGGMLLETGQIAQSIESTRLAIGIIEESFPSAVPGSGDMNDAVDLNPGAFAVVDLLAGCHYRQGEALRTSGNCPDSIRFYARSRELFGSLYRTRGESYRLTYAQVLSLLASSLANVRRSEEAIEAWDEMRGLLAPLHGREPAHYAPILAGILRYEAKASRQLGDEKRAAGFEAEAEALETAR